MSAAQIPNLNSLRRGAGRGRGRGRGGIDNNNHDQQHHHHHSQQSQSRQDLIIQRTDFDAATSRLSAVECGYLTDRFAHLILPPGIQTDRRLPLMNRGTWLRTTAIDRLVDSFLTSTTTTTNKRRQIISLGAGSDTRYFRLRQSRHHLPPSSSALDLVYHELDFPTNTSAKIRQLRSPAFAHRVRQLCGLDLLAGHVAVDLTELVVPGCYYIHALDLRELSSLGKGGDNQQQQLKGIERDVPTLLISECCLIYLAPAEAEAVLQYFVRFFSDGGDGGGEPVVGEGQGQGKTRHTPLGIVIYEPLQPHDAFGRTMVANLTARGIQLKTMEAHATLAKQRERLRGLGLGGRDGHGERDLVTSGDGDEDKNAEHGDGGHEGGGIGAVDLDFIWRTWVSEEEKERVSGLEFMDEMEEWVLLMQHYCIVWGWRDGREGPFAPWKDIPSQPD